MEKIQTKRPSWDEYFIGIMRAVSERGTCDRGKCGAIIVKNKRILTTGYVGAPIGFPHCDEAGHLIHEVINIDGTHSKHCIRTIHAEQNAIIQAARYGIAIDGSTIYTKFVPCYVCAMLIVNVGIVRVVSERRYHADKNSIETFKKANIEITILNDENEEYSNQ